MADRPQGNFLHRAHVGARKARFRYHMLTKGDTLGGAMHRGFMETFGMSFDENLKNEGFFGLKTTKMGRAYHLGGLRGMGPGGRSLVAGRALLRGAKQAGFTGSMKAVGSAAFKGAAGIFSAYSVYQGYREGGILGAVKEGGVALATNAAINMALHAAGAAAIPLAVAGIGAGALYGGFKLGEASIKHHKRLRGIEMGSPLVDPFGTAATLRQRSLSALQNSHINGRMAMGNEGTLMHSPYLR